MCISRSWENLNLRLRSEWNNTLVEALPFFNVQCVILPWTDVVDVVKGLKSLTLTFHYFNNYNYGAPSFFCYSIRRWPSPNLSRKLLRPDLRLKPDWILHRRDGVVGFGLRLARLCLVDLWWLLWLQNCVKVDFLVDCRRNNLGHWNHKKLSFQAWLLVWTSHEDDTHFECSLLR